MDNPAIDSSPRIQLAGAYVGGGAAGPVMENSPTTWTSRAIISAFEKTYIKD